MTIRTVLLGGGLALTPSEEKIAQALLADYPTAGLGSATSLARRAGVSDPTVVRLATKLGFEGYSAFQAALLAEVEERLHSPLLMMEAKRLPADNGGDGIIPTYFRSVMAGLEKTMTATPPQTFRRAEKLVMDRHQRVSLLGGRFSRFVAGMLAGYLMQLRPEVHDFGVLSPPRFDDLIDMGRHDTLIIFDYRRYQRDVISFAEKAAARGARIVLFTDPFRSPIGEFAEAIVTTPVTAASPFDTLAPAVAQIEAFVAHLLASLDEDSQRRIEDLETIRHNNAVTLDGDEGGAPPVRSPISAGPKSNSGNK